MGISNSHRRNAEQENNCDKDEKICVNHCDNTRYVSNQGGLTIVPIAVAIKSDKQSQCAPCRRNSDLEW